MPEEENLESIPEDLELAERIIELTTFFQKNSSTIEEIKSKLMEWESKSQNLDITLDEKLNEFNISFNSKLKQIEDKFTSEINTLKEKIEIQEDNFTSELQTLRETTKTQENNFNDKYSTQKQNQENLDKSLSNYKTELEKLSEGVKEEFAESSRRHEERESTLKLSVSALAELVRTQNETVTNTVAELETNIESLNDITQIHTEAFNNVRDSLFSFKEKLQEITSLSKKDQQSHFENFSRMLESFNENIRTEITLTTQNLKESDIHILNEVAEHYTRKKVGEDLQQAFATFSEEIQSQTSRTREEITQNLQNSMKEYEAIIQFQSQSIQTYKEELERIQSEIQAVIDRKVNEKYEAVFSLLSTVALHAEELSMLIKIAEIHLPRDLSLTVENEGEKNSNTRKLDEKS